MWEGRKGKNIALMRAYQNEMAVNHTPEHLNDEIIYNLHFSA